MSFAPLELDVITPLGAADCIGLIYQDGDRPEWVTFIKSTGEPWFWPNRHIRRFPYVTRDVPFVSPFTGIKPPLQAHIDRYRLSGWLPRTPGEDPGVR